MLTYQNSICSVLQRHKGHNHQVKVWLKTSYTYPPKMSFLTVAILVTAISQTQSQTISQSVTGYFNRLLNTAKMYDVLNGHDPYTLFYPSDTYLLNYVSRKGMTIQQLLQDEEAANELVRYHVINGSVPRDHLYNELVLTALNGGGVRINYYLTNGVYTAQGVTIIITNYREVTNGVIYMLADVMEPAIGSVSDVLESHNDLSSFVSAIKAAGLFYFLHDQNPITVFAPSNAAFINLGSRFQTLLANPSLLAEVVKYHVVPGTLYLAGIHTSDLHTLEEKDRLHITTLYAGYNGAIPVDNGHTLVNGTNLSATNGVVHMVDRVLIPASLQNQI